MQVKGYEIWGIRNESFRVPKIKDGVASPSIFEGKRKLDLEGYIICNTHNVEKLDCIVLTLLSIDENYYYHYTSSDYSENQRGRNYMPLEFKLFDKNFKAIDIVSPSMVKRMFFSKSDYFNASSFLDYDVIDVKMPILLGKHRFVRKVSMVDANLNSLDIGIYDVCAGSYTSLLK